jgi:hypothetical protein
VRAPRVNDKRIESAAGERKRFASVILPAWARRSPRVAEVLPLLYLHRGCKRRGMAAPVLNLLVALGVPVGAQLRPGSPASARRRDSRSTAAETPKVSVDTSTLPTRALRWRPSADHHARLLGVGDTDALATSRRMSRHDIGLAMTPTVASATSRLPRRRRRDGVQAYRISTDPVADRQRIPPRRAGPCRRGIQERQAHRTSNDPTNQTVVISKSRNTPIHSF